MEWTESDEMQNDHCSMASSPSNSCETNSQSLIQSKDLLSVKNSSSQCEYNSFIQNSSASLNLDSMSDGDLSDYSLNDSDDEEFRSSDERNNGECEKMCNNMNAKDLVDDKCFEFTLRRDIS